MWPARAAKSQCKNLVGYKGRPNRCNRPPPLKRPFCRATDFGRARQSARISSTTEGGLFFRSRPSAPDQRAGIFLPVLYVPGWAPGLNMAFCPTPDVEPLQAARKIRPSELEFAGKAGPGSQFVYLPPWTPSFSAAAGLEKSAQRTVSFRPVHPSHFP